MYFCCSVSHIINREEERKCPVHRGKILAVTVVPVDAGMQTSGCPFPDFVITVD